MFLKLLLAFFCFANPGAKSASTDPTVGKQIEDIMLMSAGGQVLETQWAIKYGVNSAEKYKHGEECNLSCPYGCCDSSEGLAYESGVYLMMSANSNEAANIYNQRAKQACATLNQISTTATNCSGAIKEVPQVIPSKNWFKSDGTCAPGAPAGCKLVQAYPGSHVYASPRVVCVEGTTCNKDYYSSSKVNKDGSVEFRVGSRTYKLTKDSFTDPKKLMAAGIPQKYAQSMVAQYSQIKSEHDKIFEVKDKSGRSVSVGSLAAAGTQIKSDGTVIIEPPSAVQQVETLMNNQEALMGQSTGDVVPSRLKKKFNGEEIHVQTTDIFQAISHRYQSISHDSLFGETPVGQ